MDAQVKPAHDDERSGATLPGCEAASDPQVVSWALLLVYHGGPFVGWQRQANSLVIQDVIETAADRLNRGKPANVPL